MLSKRNINIDLIKCFAIFSVISVHFFPNSKWLYTPLGEMRSYFMIFMHAFFMVCVPLFLITTGFLMNKATLHKKYYLGSIKVIMIYVLDAICYLMYRFVFLNETIGIRDGIYKILGFDIGYAWYVEMYLGLFVLIPFLNIIYNNLESKNNKITLIITLLFLTSVPTITNIDHDLLPMWWIDFYPILYYFIGCYISEFKPQFGKIKSIIIILVSLLLTTYICVYKSEFNIYKYGIYGDFNNLFVVIVSTLVFIFLLNINLNKLSNKIKLIIVYISQLSFGMYLTSSIIDNMLYYKLINNFNLACIKGYVTMVPIVFILSLGASIFLNILYIIIDKLFIKKIFKLLKLT